MTAKPSLRNSLAACALALGPGLLVLTLWAIGATQPPERPLYDLALRTIPKPASSPVVLVKLDEETFRALGGRDPDRAEIAKALQTVATSKPKLVVVDLLLKSARTEEGDAALETALRLSPTLLASSPAQQQEPLLRFRAAATGVGSIDLATDPDGILRGILPPYTTRREDGQVVIRRLPLSLECARRIWFPDGPPSVELTEKGGVILGDRPFLMSGDRWLIPFSGGDGTLPHVSFQELLKDSGTVPDLAGKVVMFGNTRADLHDYFSVPLPVAPQTALGFEARSTNSMTGLEVHGQAIAALLDGRSLKTPSRRAEGLLLAALCLFAAGFALLPIRPSRAIGLWFGGLLLLAAGALWALRSGLVLPLFAGGAAWLLYAGASVGYHRWKDLAARRAVERLFGRYVSPNIASRLLANPGLVNPGGRKKTLTILFSDIRGFTNLSETIPPEQVTELLNLYFTEMMQLLFAHDGTYDKFIGDALLAFFGDPVDQPDQSERGLACAVAMQERAAELRARFAAEGRPQLHIGIAVHTGPAVVGNHGSAENWSYTVIGDTVNLAARLQGLAQRDEVILSASTAARIPNLRERYIVEEMDPVKVKGKSEPIEILRVVGRRP